MDQALRLKARVDGFVALVRTSTEGEKSFDEYVRDVAGILVKMYEVRAAAIYLAEDYGFSLMGASYAPRNLPEQGVPDEYVPMGRGITTLAMRARKTLHLHVEISSEGECSLVVVDVQAQKRVRTSTGMPVWARDILVAPVFSYDRVIALIVLADDRDDAFEDDDLVTLSAAADYVSSEVMNAVSIAESERAMYLTESASRLAASFNQATSIDDRLLADIAHTAAEVTSTHVVVLDVDADTDIGRVVYFDDSAYSGPELSLGLDTDRVFADGAALALVEPDSAYGIWAARHTDLDHGVAMRFMRDPQEGRKAMLLALRGPHERALDGADIEFFSRLAAVIHSSLERENKRVDEERISHVLQAGLRNELPRARGISSSSLYISATSSAVVGGDFFDLYEVSEGHVVVVVGDVSGKGVEAAAMASLVKTALAAYAWDGLDPASMLSSLNTLLLNFSRLDRFASLVVVSLDLMAHTGTYCSAGHPPAMLVHAPREPRADLEMLTVSSPVVGAFENLAYTNGTFAFDKGDVLYLYTDGTTEARSPDGAFFGEAALRECVLRACRGDINEVPSRILEEVTTFAQGTIKDDIAMVALRIDA